MGLGTEERDELRTVFGAAFLDKLSESEPPGVVIIDFMQFVKFVPDNILTKGDMMTLFINKVKRIMLSKTLRVRVVIVLVDGEPVPVKRMVEHAKRYKEKNVFKASKGPYMPASNDDLIPKPWIRFAGNYKLLRRELYPLLFNALLFCQDFTPQVGQMLVLSGFPGRSKFQTVYQQAPWECKTNASGDVLLVVPWEREELPIKWQTEQEDPDLYNRVYFVENTAPCQEFPQGALRRGEWLEAKNNISEADTRMFYFEHWFQNEHILFYLNDGDIFSIGLLYAFERVVDIQPHDGKYVFRNKHTALLPYKKKEKKVAAAPAAPPIGGAAARGATKGVASAPQGGAAGAAGAAPKTEEFVDLNLFYELVNNYKPFCEAGVQNAEATMAFLLIMGGSDFFDDFLKGIGSQTVIWPVFFKNAVLFSHMIQKSKAVPKSTRTKREVIIDEDMFRKFVYYCYMHKYETAALTQVAATSAPGGAGGNTLTFAALSNFTKSTKNGLKDTKYHMPDRNTTRLWCRQVEWNLNYWINAPLGFDVSPFETWYGLPYYPYIKDETAAHHRDVFKMVDVVAHKPKPVDQVYAQHMFAYCMQKKKRPNEAEQQAKKQRVVENLQHKIKY